MVDFERLTADFDRCYDALARKENANFQSLNREEVSAKMEVEKDFRERRKELSVELASKREKIKGSYIQNVASEIVKSLHTDYAIMVDREGIGALSDEDLDIARTMLGVLGDLKTADREKVKGILNLLRKRNPAMEYLNPDNLDKLQKAREPHVVNSFVGFYDGAPVADDDCPLVAVLSPVKEDGGSLLVKSLEDVVLARQINFNTYYVKSVGDFRITRFYPCNRGHLDVTAEDIVSAFNKIQPEGFAQANLRHQGHVVPYDSILYVAEKPRLEDYAEVSVPRKPREVSHEREKRHLRFDSDTVDGIREEALERLARSEKYRPGEGIYLSSENLAHVLGVSEKSVPNLVKIRPELTRAKEIFYPDGSKRPRVYFDVGQIGYFIRTKIPSKTVGWQSAE